MGCVWEAQCWTAASGVDRVPGVGTRAPFPSPGSEALVLGSQSEFFVKTGLCQSVKERHLKGGGAMGVRSIESQPDATPGQNQQLSYQSPKVMTSKYVRRLWKVPSPVTLSFTLS